MLSASRVPVREALPRRIVADFQVRVVDGLPRAVVVVSTDDDARPRPFGDPLDDNALHNDAYRYHDVMHLAHFAHIGWSPTVRALLGRKRRSEPDVDRVQDGARAIAIEEALCALAFGLREDEPSNPLPPAGVVALRRLTTGLEVSDVPDIVWQAAYAEAFDVMAALARSCGGQVVADRSKQTVTFRPLSGEGPMHTE